ncbi:hypothetical protein OVT28_02285 [Pseudomonas aeruginosa]|uniref:hypothetical protein n=1 Tax=Pseudomonas aeruginosa TaxID=287 RepID=UPI0022702E5B|nr:hypothetical protein [Pseudomonas aeruginosa]MCY0285310.1 hypothetical protein [Pseudomonas aeruginosa]MCY0396491.1 hypothetical protein [Pseudomonas aeruginosa]
MGACRPRRYVRRDVTCHAGQLAGFFCTYTSRAREAAQVVEVPVWAAAGLKKSDDLQTKVRALLAERWQRIGYEAQLQAANRGCQD